MTMEWIPALCIKEFLGKETRHGLRSGVAFRCGLIMRGAMKRFALLSLLVAFGLGACERHDFEETRQLHEHEAAHGEKSGEKAEH